MSDTSASERFVESVGPIVVKEVRQGLRAKVFAIFFGTLLAVCLTTALVFVVEASNSLRSSTGDEAFGLFLSALGAVCFFVIPFVAFRSMLRELEDETWVLLTLTGLGARSIVRGKWVSAMSQALLFGSACAPFVLFSYFLNGIDLVQIVSGLVLAAGWSSALTALGLAVATQAHSKLGRTIAHFMVLAVLGFGTAGGIAFAWVLAEEGHRIASDGALRNFVVGVAIFTWFLAWLLLEGAAAGLALPSEAASKGTRVAYLVTSMLALAYGLTLFFLEEGSRNDAVGGQIVTCLFLTVTSAFCISERDGWPKQAGTGGWLKPGAARSYWLFIFVITCSLLMWGTLLFNARGGSPSDKHVRGLFAAFSYPVLYASIGVVVGRLSPLKRFGEPIATRVGYLLSIVLGVTVSLVLSFAVDGRADSKAMNALNPLVGMVNFVDRSSSELQGPIVLLGAVTLLAVFLAAVTLHGRDEVRSS